jgi:2-polyprenyl-3-methyl-5-hydroxy-6-metoxy-1,4-benzoquinol methylase
MIKFQKKQVNRQAHIISHCIGKNVLNIGCLAADKKSTLHKQIESVANHCVGLDLFHADLPNYVKGNAENFNLEKKFDVVIVGEVIEHLWDIKGCITSAYHALVPRGELIITTPNAYAPVFLKDALLGRIVKNDPNHTLLFDITTLINMLNNHAATYFEGQVLYYEESEANTVAYKVQKLLAKMRTGYSRGLIAELTRNE